MALREFVCTRWPYVTVRKPISHVIHWDFSTLTCVRKHKKNKLWQTFAMSTWFFKCLVLYVCAMLEALCTHFELMKCIEVFFSVQVRVPACTSALQISPCCLDSRQMSIFPLQLSPALQCLSYSPSLFPPCPLSIFDKLARSKGIVKTSNFIKYR